MKTIGIIRNLDMLGRIVLPSELRHTLGIVEKDGLEIFVDKECIVLRKYKPTCIFCNSVSDVTEYKGKKICASCFDDMSPR
ncbi:AbrB/MazE/SpoVT family DNA-binding domain-containing protein [Aneurinibacillus migulanus]|uniref:AbrB family transcriptional regulator n=1 Tax=Aneurinibacillus migulanus TaxID=47500 RepID=A0A0D1WGS1_ANEMI|nr:AbrB/MazE/SpoVT family DNA-binding domain-containing protein [Aneurinibacillus migulanus]KIV57755.1 AbrB family transcriptional regulator [Aneurinibacillus migulanus]KON97149.1 AbrB family transcriptional regulator [Aneurinibacillus migulanus]MED0896414.1 AbrB/MazE/SpoVT family DNA-binding domain-containing protein [Aneurinibacillus migulanus]MED1616073.1 AbrB/MazE/SpoVT family DNA-binding domain-containing protein [Aneurinibacillus migulanus]SDJ96720.1 transcriptional pleiotropic regulator